MLDLWNLIHTNDFFDERLKEIKKRRLEREKEMELIKQQGFYYYLTKAGDYIREATHDYEDYEVDDQNSKPKSE